MCAATAAPTSCGEGRVGGGIGLDTGDLEGEYLD